MSSPMLILKVIKTEIQGKQLTPNARSCFRLPEKLDALTTNDSAAPCRGWRNTVAVTSTCFVSSYTSITSCKSNVFFFPKSDLNLSSGASNLQFLFQRISALSTYSQSEKTNVHQMKTEIFQIQVDAVFLISIRNSSLTSLVVTDEIAVIVAVVPVIKDVQDREIEAEDVLFNNPSVQHQD
ncbi:hypothetical protein T4E_1467 [Trichinella pseudospiralis]|uniref:Uncharacterized protein n=1 Tax=Trichinella pseudospiralis TaxID=6337 RepID=A0A0V0XEJ7_TRIPS|nr:hypothetical protein T4E_1467 [Trichinella pseudospiralis]